jgi:hypothetical protein
MLIGNKELKVSIKFAKNNSRVIRNQHTILEFKHKEHSENFSMKKIKKVSKFLLLPQIPRRLCDVCWGIERKETG